MALIEHRKLIESEERDTTELVALAYDELRELADRLITRERPNHTLQATALVHEMWLRISNTRRELWTRDDFLAAAATVMRRVLVDHARGVGRAKRGGSHQTVSFDQDPPAGRAASDVHILAVDEALDELERIDARKAQIVERRFFGGLRYDEIAKQLDVSIRTVEREWNFARCWLAARIEDDSRTGCMDD